MGILDSPYIRLALSLLALAVAVGCGGRAHHLVETVPAVPLTDATDTLETVEAAPPRLEAELPVVHVLEKGQTLWRIARTYDVDLEELKRVNGIIDVTSLEVGQSIIVPGATAPVEIQPYSAPVVDSDLWTWPVAGGSILSTFGAPRRGHRHTGVDIGGNHGTPIVAARSGRVTYSGAGMRGYGKTVILDHGSGVSTLYAHNSSLAVKVGDRVDRGQRIARVGRTGNASTNHCHFEIRERDVPVNPLRHIAPLVGAAR